MQSQPSSESPTATVGREALVALGVALVLYGAIAIAWGESGRFLKYPVAAAQWANGTLQPERLVDFSPVYLALHRVLGGVSSGAPESGVAVAWLQVLTVALATAGLWWLMSQFEIERRWRLAAIACWLLNPSLLVYANILEPEAILIGLEVALLFVTARALARDGVPGARECVLMAGVAVLATLTRPTLLPAGLAMAGALWLRYRGRPKVGARVGLIVALLVMAVIGLTVRNGLVAKSWSPSVMNPGTVLYEGNNPMSWGNSAAYPPAVYELGVAGESDAAHQSYRVLARLSTGDPDLSVGGVNAFWVGKALDYITDHPGRFVRLLGVKLDAIARAEREHDLGPAEAIDRWLQQHWIIGVPMSLVVFLAIWGLAVSLSRWRELLVLLVITLTQVASMMVLYPSARQRLTLLPCLVILVAVALQDLGRRGRQGLLTGALLLALGAAWIPATDRQADRRHERAGLAQGRTLLLQAQRARDAGRLDEAVRTSTRAYVAAPELLARSRLADLPLDEEAIRTSAGHLASGSPSQQFDAARLDHLIGDLDGARAVFESLEGEDFLRSAVSSSRPEVHRAELELRAGRREQALELLDATLDESPGEPFALALRAVTSRVPGRDGASADEPALRSDVDELALRRDVDELALRRYVDELSADMLLAESEVIVGDSRAAASRLAPWLDELTDAGEPARRLRLLHIRALTAIDPERAEGRYVSLMRTGGEPVLFEEEIVSLFESAANARPADLEAQWLFVRILRQYGRFEQAGARLDDLPEAMLADPRLQQERRLLRAVTVR